MLVLSSFELLTINLLSVVAFTESGVLVGHEAQAQAIVNPKNTIFDAKRFIGKQYVEEK